MKSRNNKRIRISIILLVNAVFLTSLFAVFVMYRESSRKELYNQNLNDVSNINQS